ncbi:Hsp70 family protein [Desulforhabdus sp. TSK]|uniref:Hsp70 family protein n=1 Tax=Desulforhabdus sp. TSK TaxID=2925014 RepID=UPI001FC8CC09|nr:Hsp70 family protein [Desulforhabdus sp. TSK]GKT09146.1 hypothetical protein DSTSK_24510 [Desulforhabdus sp. TSK]
MHKLGLDFGTTNSTLSYLDPSRKVIECYRMGGADGSPYIPSFVSYDVSDGSICIGDSARINEGDSDYKIFSRFKMLLSEDRQEKLERYGYEHQSPRDCAKAFVEYLIQNYCQEQNIESSIENVVITVPEIWVREGRHASRECLKEICQELGLPVRRFLSEPVAAAVYFAHCFREQYGRSFDGHVLVCDYGGGTLDLSLSKVEAERISVLECTGKGYDSQTLGKAGVAFDEATVMAVYERLKGMRLSRTEQTFPGFMREFEERKIKLRKHVDKILEQYLKNKTVNKKAFEVNSVEFKASDLADAFNLVIKSELLDALTEMKSYLDEHQVDCNDSDRFRVVMVGGFSGFYLVQQTVREFFGSETTEDQRFNSCFTVEDTALAISKGAALIANEMFSIDPVCPITVGLMVWKDDGTGEYKFTEIPFLKKGVKISQYLASVFLKGLARFSIDPRNRKLPITIFLRDKRGRWRISLEKAVDRLLPNAHQQGNQWKIGFSVDENYLFTFHAVDLSGSVQETPLGALLEKVAGIILEEG